MELTEKPSTAARYSRAASSACDSTPCVSPTARRVPARWWSTPGGVAILAIDSEGRVLLVRQYRYPFERVLTEIPAGKREPGEPPFITAQRELQEEVGVTADTWTELGTLIPSPGCYGETLYLYMAQDLHFGATHPDEDEFLEPLRIPLDEAVRQCMDGTLTDAKTVAAILKGKILRES